MIVRHRDKEGRVTGMNYLFAPMEGITGYVYRNAHHRHFCQIHQYYTPFLVPNQNRRLTTREMQDICPEHNAGVPVVPQIMSCKADEFLWAAQKAWSLGYREVNLNLGCPSATVVTRKRGAGFLAFPEELDAFLNQVCTGLDRLGMELSVKTRIGKERREEFVRLLEIYNRYPLRCLVIHPRLQTDFYRNTPDLETFALAVGESQNPVCYNGDLFSVEDIRRFRERFPSVEQVMLGRGLLANPALAEEKAPDKDRIQAFHRDLLAGYRQAIPGDRNVLFKMKEVWAYLGSAFTNFEKYGKKIKKSQKLTDYEQVVERLLEEQEIKEKPVFGGYGKTV